LKKAIKTKPAGKDRFDPWLGLTIADTWEALGQQIGRVRDDEGKFDTEKLTKWAAAVISESGKDLARIVTPSSLQRFVETSLRVLEAKAKGKSIRAQAKRLVRRRRFQSIKVEEKPGSRYLDLSEPESVFWAVEYQLLLEGLGTPSKANDEGWLQAVGFCDGCGSFFVRARREQRFHSDACRAEFTKSSGSKTTTKKRSR
jgi:hypothetical protein